MQGKFKCLGDIKNLCFGSGCSITREPWPFFDVKGSEIIFGKNVVISSGVNVFTHTHQFEKSNWRDLEEVANCEPTIINNNAFIGVNALIMHTCKYVGKSSVIGAGSVVINDVPDYEIWSGNPAKRIGVVCGT